MQALLNIPTLTNSLTSIRQFHDTIENHMRGLSALGKSEETYGDLLIPIILGKLPAELQRNLAREQNNGTWTIILKEIRIMEASNSINNQTKAFEELNLPSMTTLFHTKVNSPTPVLPHTPSTPGKSEPLYVYCNGKHYPTTCKVITDPQKRYECVKRANRCFNCLGRHRVSMCKSQTRCLTCQRKHHTSICSGKPSQKPITETTQDQSREPSSVYMLLSHPLPQLPSTQQTST